MKVKDISDEDLFRTITNVLWCWYDSGGISVRRSYQASLIECFMDLYTLNYRSADVAGNVLEEAMRRYENPKRREPVSEIQLLLPFSEMETLSNDEFTMLVLIELNRWYREDSERLGFLMRMHWIMAKDMKYLFESAHPEITASVFKHIQFNSISIVAHGNDRQNFFSKCKDRFREFAQYGINPWTSLF